MKRSAIAIALLIALLLTGCCYAPGHEGSTVWEMRYDLPEWLESDYEVATKPTVPPDAPTEPVALPDPDVDLGALPERADSDFVNVLDYIPDLVVDLRYATPNNFTGQVIYTFDGIYLRYGTVQKLMAVQQELRANGYLLKIWDAYRPVSAQYSLWTACPDPAYVANPDTGYSTHSCGNTIDVTIVDANGVELEMPTGFDEFGPKADRDYSDCSATAAANAQFLEDVMEANGFEGYDAEWWHFSDEKVYPVEEVFDPGEISTWYADCNEYINIRKEPNVSSASIGKINKNEQFTLLGWSGGFAYVEFKGVRGFVNADYIQKVSS